MAGAVERSAEAVSGDALDALRARARRDHPRSTCAWADAEAWARGEGEGSAAEAAALKRRDAEAWIPGLAARPAVMAMGWSIVAVVVAAGALSWFPADPRVALAGDVIKIGGCAIAVAAAAWGFLSEVRGWEGSDASRWLLKRRVKAFRKALDARRRAVCDAVVCVGDDGIGVYRSADGAITADDYPPALVAHVALEPRDGCTTLRVTVGDMALAFDWLRRDPAFEAAVHRFAATLRTRRAEHATEAPAA